MNANAETGPFDNGTSTLPTLLLFSIAWWGLVPSCTWFLAFCTCYKLLGKDNFCSGLSASANHLPLFYNLIKKIHYASGILILIDISDIHLIFIYFLSCHRWIILQNHFLFKSAKEKKKAMSCGYPKYWVSWCAGHVRIFSTLSDKKI